jgi:cell division protein FtsQ
MATNRKRSAKRRRVPAVRQYARRAAPVIVVLALASIVVWGLLGIMDRPIDTVTLTGEFERVTPLQVEAALGDLSGVGFLSADLENLRRSVEDLPWVDEARVQRQWPGEVRIAITEQVPAARWQERGLLNVRGDLFLPEVRYEYAELPALSGPAGSEGMVARRYLDMRGPLVESGHLLTGVRLDDRGAWRIELGNGMEIRLGRQQVAERFDRFLHIVVPILASSKDGAAYVDMRYSRGFAIAWSSAMAPGRGEQKEKHKDV